MTMTLITHAIALILGGAGGYLWGAKVKATAQADAAKVAATATAVEADVKKL